VLTLRYRQTFNDATDRAEETLDNVYWIEVDELGVEVASVKNQKY
jgi:flavin-binding protein dodecin